MRTVLVVDDDAGIVAFIEEALTDEGYHVLTAVDGAWVQIAQERHPDVILLDTMLPGMDGVEVSRRLRADLATADIPLIAMTAYYHVWLRNTLLLADDHLPKPFHLQRLYETVARWATPA